MTTFRLAALTCFTLAASVAAQGGHFLFSTTQTEATLYGSGGTVLQNLYPNEMASIEFGSVPCSALSAEKWAPRTMFHTQAGDADGDDMYWEANLFGRIDGILEGRSTTASGAQNQRSVYYSVSQSMGTAVSGAPGLRPGDIGRIARTGVGDGQVQYFLRAEDLQSALGLPPAPLLVNLDACTWGPNHGVLFSIEDDIICNLLTGGPTLVRDGDVLVIPGAAITWGPNMTVAAVLPGSAVVAYTELMMDTFVANAQVTDRNGVCVTQIGDVDALDLDWANSFAINVPTGYGVIATVPHLRFAGQNLTGASVLTTLGGGAIETAMCGALGTSCGSGPTLGDQMGLRPAGAALGVASSVNGLCSARILRFVSEAQAPQIPVFTAPVIDIASPGAMTWTFLTFVPAGPGAVAPSAPFVWGTLCYPDFYPAPWFVGSTGTASGFGTQVGPVVPFPADLVFQCITITPWGTIEASTPSTVEVF